MNEKQLAKAKELALSLLGQGFSPECLVYVQYYPETMEGYEDTIEGLSHPKAPGTDVSQRIEQFYTLKQILDM